MAIDPAWIQAGSQVLGGALGGGASSSASSDAYNRFDASNWNVNTGEGDLSATQGALSPWLLALAALGLVLWYKVAKR